MDELVKQAMLKWPNVPSCTGWLGLDDRGDWYMRDDATQALGTFQGKRPGSKGSKLAHDKLIAFIERNYLPDAQGCWYFQNGPQKVFVELMAAPYVWRTVTESSGRCTLTAVGQSPSGLPNAVLMDETGRLFLAADTAWGEQLGLLHSQDMWQASEAIETGHWGAVEHVQFQALPQRFGYVLSPQQQEAKT